MQIPSITLTIVEAIGAFVLIRIIMPGFITIFRLKAKDG
jgi:hypothetical protein